MTPQGVGAGLSAYHNEENEETHMGKILRLLLGLAACGVLVFAAVNLTGYLRESRQSSRLNESLIDDAVLTKAPEADTAAGAQQDATSPAPDAAPITVDFAVLAKTNEDIIGWLYSEGTPINLPVVRSADNKDYLRRLVDGSQNSAGTLFVDYRNAGDFSDSNTVIYGHNMKNREMFGTLSQYRKQAYFDAHPVMWLLTPQGDYRVEPVAGYVTQADSEVYAFSRSGDAVFATVQQAMEKSDFRTDTTIAPGDRFLTLSTCSYEYDNARYVLIGKLVPLT